MAVRICPLSFNHPSACAIAPNWSYGHMNGLIGQAVHQLSLMGLKKGDCIVLSSDPSETTIALLFAAWRLSLIVALVSARLPSATLQKHLQNIPVQLKIENPSSFFIGQIDERRELDMNAIALLLLTSGSSGMPKWAAFTLAQLFDSAETVAYALNAQPQDRWLLSLPLHHVGGLGIILRAFCSGGTVVCEDKTLSYSARILSAQAHFASLVPTQLYRLLQSNFYPLSTQLLIGGAPMPQHFFQQALDRNYRILLSYGLTEMSSTVFLTTHPVWHENIPYLSLPLPGRQVKLDHDELLVSGTSLFAGYGYPPQKPFDGWFPTRDCGRFHEKYGYAICGRKDFQFFSGGENIQPEEIETMILSYPQVEQAIVVPIPDEEFGARVFAFIKTTEPHDKILHYLSQFLPKFKIPIGTLPLPESDSLKPNREELRQFINNNYHIFNTAKN